jgi:Uma2 family endonuclease
MDTITIRERKVTPPPPDDPFYYGSRDVLHKLPDGTTQFEQIPLTLEDTLHPQEGDYIVESDLHGLLCDYIAAVIRSRFASDPSVLVLSDTGVYWDDPALSYTHHSPDIAVIFGIKNRKPEYRSFRVGTEGVRPRLIIELVSPNNRVNDIETNVEQYHEVEIPTYIIADREHLGDPWKLIGYQRRPDTYIPLPSDANGRIWLQALGLWLGAVDTRLVCFDRNGNEIGDYHAMVQQAKSERQRAETEKQRAETEKQRADAAEAKAKALEEELARLRKS